MRSYIKVYSDTALSSIQTARDPTLKPFALRRKSKAATIIGANYILGSGTAVGPREWFQTNSNGPGVSLVDSVQAMGDVTIPDGTWFGYLNADELTRWLVIPFDQLVTQTTSQDLLKRVFDVLPYSLHPLD